MRAYDIIKKKRDGSKLTDEEIRFFVNGYTSGEIADYQAAAFCMAIYFRGMDGEETSSLTFAFRDSGSCADFSEIKGLRADKHSTGGVGDKTSLIVAPIVASLGLKVAKMSGRGLGHTGGTVDKLQSIPGYKTSLEKEEFIKIVNRTGMSIIGQTAVFAPADKKFYALRDVTATVDSIPLIASSIMGKKLAADDDIIVLDVKTGSGAFMKSLEKSVELAEAMVDIGKRAGKKIAALVTDMDKPLGNAIGNSLEVIEAVKTLKGEGSEDLTDLCIELSAKILQLAGKGEYEKCRQLAKNAVSSGKAYETFKKSVAAQGGRADLLDNTDLFKKAKYSKFVLAEKSGYINRVDCEGYGESALLLGAGRNKIDDEIDYAAGIILNKKTGDKVEKGEVIATLFTNKENSLPEATERLVRSTIISDEKPVNGKLILKVIE